VQKDTARQGALSHLLKTFFDGSTEKAVAALLDLKAAQLSSDELDRVAQLVNQAKIEGR
jgi:predicted transcriptional regulator